MPPLVTSVNRKWKSTKFNESYMCHVSSSGTVKTLVRTMSKRSGLLTTPLKHSEIPQEVWVQRQNLTPKSGTVAKNLIEKKKDIAGLFVVSIVIVLLLWFPSIVISVYVTGYGLCCRWTLPYLTEIKRKGVENLFYLLDKEGMVDIKYREYNWALNNIVPPPQHLPDPELLAPPQPLTKS